MASIAASSTFHSFSTTKSHNLSSTILLPLSKNLTFRSNPIVNSKICSFTKQSRLGLSKLSCVSEGGGEGVVVAKNEQQQQQETVSVPVSPSDMLTIFFQAYGTLNEATIPNVTKALEEGLGTSAYPPLEKYRARRKGNQTNVVVAVSQGTTGPDALYQSNVG